MTTRSSAAGLLGILKAGTGKIGRVAANQVRFRLRSRPRGSTTSARRALLSIHDGTYHRYVYPLAKCLEYAGYEVSVKMTSAAVSAADKYVHLLLDDGFVTAAGGSRQAPSTITLDDETGTRTLEITPDYFRSGAACRIPLPMHPYMYSRGLLRAGAELRNNESRNIRVLYAGSRGASHHDLAKHFSLVPREDVLRHLTGSRTIRHEVMRDTGQLDQPYPDTALLAIRERCDIPQEQLLRAMSKASFFLALPGWVVPQSHNLTECMSVGTIPVLEYASVLPEPLTPGVNCLAYDGLADVEAAISRAMSMADDEVRRMRRNVLEYYDTFLSPEAVYRTVRDCRSGVIGLMAEDNSVACLG